MDTHFKRDQLDIKLKKYILFLFIISSPIGSQQVIYLLSRDSPHNSLKGQICFKMLRTIRSLRVPNLQSVPSSLPKLQLINCISQLYPIVPGLKLLERSESSVGKETNSVPQLAIRYVLVRDGQISYFFFLLSLYSYNQRVENRNRK